MLYEDEITKEMRMHFRRAKAATPQVPVIELGVALTYSDEAAGNSNVLALSDAMEIARAFVDQRSEFHYFATGKEPPQPGEPIPAMTTLDTTTHDYDYALRSLCARMFRAGQL